MLSTVSRCRRRVDDTVLMLHFPCRRGVWVDVNGGGPGSSRTSPAIGHHRRRRPVTPRHFNVGLSLGVGRYVSPGHVEFG